MIPVEIFTRKLMRPELSGIKLFRSRKTRSSFSFLSHETFDVIRLTVKVKLKLFLLRSRELFLNYDSRAFFFLSCGEKSHALRLCNVVCCQLSEKLPKLSRCVVCRLSLSQYFERESKNQKAPCFVLRDKKGEMSRKSRKNSLCCRSLSVFFSGLMATTKKIETNGRQLLLLLGVISEMMSFNSPYFTFSHSKYIFVQSFECENPFELTPDCFCDIFICSRSDPS